MVGRGEIQVRGGVRIDGQDLYTYAVRRSAPVFSEPSTSAFLGHLRAGICIKGSPPSSQGWIALSDDETWVLDDGRSLALIERPQPLANFARRLGPLPEDALLEHATVEEMSRGGILITVPRRTRPTSQPQPRAVPKAAPPRPRSASTDAPPRRAPYKPVTPPPPPARETQEETARGDAGLEALEKALRAPKPAATSGHPPPTPPAKEVASGLHSSHHGLSSEDPILVEVAASVHNVSSPTEAVESWFATDDGGFVPVIRT